MENERNNLDIFDIIKKVKKLDDFNFALMSRDERIEYIANQMEKIEKEHTDIVVRIGDQTDDHNDDFIK